MRQYMIKLDYDKKIYLLSGISIILIVASLILIINPLFSRITSLNSEVYDKRVQLAIYQQQRLNVEQTQQDYKKIKDDIENISKIFVNKDNILDLISKLEKISAAHSITQSINLDSTPADESADMLPMQITLNGKFQNLVNYLADIERLDYYIVIYGINFSTSDEDINLQLSINLFS